MLKRLLAVTSAALLLTTAPLAAQTLYLGEQEVDASDPVAMAAVIERCADLAAAAPDAAASAAFTRTAPPPAQSSLDPIPKSAPQEAPVEGRTPPTAEPGLAQEPAIARDLLALSVDQPQPSGGDSSDSAASGAEGSGQGTDTAEEPTEASNVVNLARVTLGACKEAGLVF